jgi:ADP-ribosylglycohydrolase
MSSLPFNFGLPPDHDARLERARLALDGLSVGDAFGQRFFRVPGTVSSVLAARSVPPAPWRYTDDTEMALAVTEVLRRHGRIEQDRLAEVFARRYRADPHRGYGFTAHDILTAIGAGKPWRRAARGAFGGAGSMGNGGAMRVAPVGAYFADDLDRVMSEAQASAEVTHAHAEGQAGAVAVAAAAAWAWRARDNRHGHRGEEMLAFVRDHTPEGQTRDGLDRALTLPADTPVRRAVLALGNGSKVTAPDTVPFALWCAAHHLHDYAEVLWRTVSGLGDRDTTCAIAGGVAVLAAGRQSIPVGWLAAREPLSLDW